METDAWTDTRTVVVSGVPDVLTVSRMTDKLTIHFQTRRRSDGGDVEAVRYPTNTEGVAFVTFDKAADAERVVRKEEHIMVDDEFPEDYVLTVFPFTRDVYFYVPSAMVDLSVFGKDQESVLHSLRSAHRSLRFRPFLHQSKASIEGPFTAIQALREDLIRRTRGLKSSVSAQTAAVKLKETPLNPRVISHHEFVGSLSCSGSKAKLKPASSNSLSAPQQTTGEATKVQTLLSNAKTQNTPLWQKVSGGSLAAGSFRNTDDEEVQGARSRPQTPARTRRAKAEHRHVFGEEINAGIRSLSGLDLLPAEEISAKQPQKDDTRKDVSQSFKSHSKDTEKLSAVCPGDMCIWVESHTFSYIKTFVKKEFDMCLGGLEASIEPVAGTDLIQILLPENPSSDGASAVPEAFRKLSALVDALVSMLRVHQIDYKKPEKRILTQICDEVTLLIQNVLYVLEDSSIKVVGPSVPSHLFWKEVEDRFAKLKDKSLRI